ncbi:hypothetical protein ACXPWS_13640 [Mycobacterium sp. BMJ-28]
MNGSVEIDQVLALTRESLKADVKEMLRRITLDDHTDAELVAFAVLIRPVYDRRMAQISPPAAVIKLKAVK